MVATKRSLLPLQMVSVHHSYKPSTRSHPNCAHCLLHRSDRNPSSHNYPDHLSHDIQHSIYVQYRPLSTLDSNEHFVTASSTRAEMRTPSQHDAISLCSHRCSTAHPWLIEGTLSHCTPHRSKLSVCCLVWYGNTDVEPHAKPCVVRDFGFAVIAYATKVSD